MSWVNSQNLSLVITRFCFKRCPKICCAEVFCELDHLAEMTECEDRLHMHSRGALSLAAGCDRLLAVSRCYCWQCWWSTVVGSVGDDWWRQQQPCRRRTAAGAPSSEATPRCRRRLPNTRAAQAASGASNFTMLYRGVRQQLNRNRGFIAEKLCWGKLSIVNFVIVIASFLVV